VVADVAAVELVGVHRASDELEVDAIDMIATSPTGPFSAHGRSIASELP
jgi:hypothetical protein